MGDVEARCNLARVMDVLPRTAGALAMLCGAVVVQLERDADDLVALFLEQGGNDRRIDAARHGDDNPCLLRGLRQVEAVERRIARWRCNLTHRRHSVTSNRSYGDGHPALAAQSGGAGHSGYGTGPPENDAFPLLI